MSLNFKIPKVNGQASNIASKLPSAYREERRTSADLSNSRRKRVPTPEPPTAQRSDKTPQRVKAEVKLPEEVQELKDARNEILAAVNHSEDPERRQIEIRKLADRLRPLNDEEMQALEASRKTVPNLLFRAYSCKGTKSTRGHSSQEKYLPAQMVHNGGYCHANMYQMSDGELILMIGSHLVWLDKKSDEFLSWTCSLLFATEHALGRARKDDPQWEVFICIIDPRKAKPCSTDPALDGHSAPFYPALDLCNTLNIRSWAGWTKPESDALQERKFTHEYLTPGVLEYEDTTWRHVPIVELHEDGLFIMYAQFLIPEEAIETLWDKDMIKSKSEADKKDPKVLETVFGPNASTGLYTRLLGLRRIGFPEDGQEPETIPYDHLSISFRCAQRFINAATPQAQRSQKPPIHLLCHFLSLVRRPSRDPGFLQFIRDHGYVASDLTEHLYEGIHKIPNHLYEMKQYVELLRDVAFALGLPDDTIPPTEEVGDYRKADDAKMPAKRYPLYESRAEKEERKRKRKEWLKKLKGRRDTAKKGAAFRSSGPDAVEDDQIEDGAMDVEDLEEVEADEGLLIDEADGDEMEENKILE